MSTEKHFTIEVRQLIADGIIPLEFISKKRRDMTPQEKRFFDSLFEEIPMKSHWYPFDSSQKKFCWWQT